MTRDSWVLWLGIAGAIVAYLVASEPPTQWAYADWMKFVALLIGIISGKLATSPLSGENDAKKVDLSKIAPALLVLALLPGLVGCGAKTTHTAAVVSEQAAGGLLTAQKVVTTAYQTGAIPQATYLTLQSRFEQIAGIGIAANQALREGNQQGALLQIAAGLKLLEGAINLDVPKITGDSRVIVLIAIQSVRSGLLAYAAALGGLPAEEM